MNFRLFYQGPLKANGTPPEKQHLRRCFHRQLKTLWAQPPLDDVAKCLNIDPSKGKSLGVNRGKYLCVPLVCEALELVAALEITMLRPEAPGRVLTQAGDIDNRLKTLLDSLQVPKPDQLGSSDAPTVDETPFYCLVEDDNLITSLSVTTDRLLTDATSNNEVILLIRVTLEFTHQHFTNLVPPPRLL
jgi:hypothetical protein